MDFAKIVLERLRELDLNINQAEAQWGLPQGYIRGVVRDDAKRAIPSIEKAAKIAEALGLEFHLGPYRKDPFPAEPPVADYAKIPLVEAKLSAGHGSLGSDEAVAELSFRTEWLRRVGISPAKAVLSRVAGDSMSPTIHAGDIVLIDTARKDVRVRQRGQRDKRPSPIYALRDGTGARVKRIERPEQDLIILLSDNPEFPPEVVKDIVDLSIIGRVVWWGHTNKE